MYLIKCQTILKKTLRRQHLNLVFWVLVAENNIHAGLDSLTVAGGTGTKTGGLSFSSSTSNLRSILDSAPLPLLNLATPVSCWTDELLSLMDYCLCIIICFVDCGSRCWVVSSQCTFLSPLGPVFLGYTPVHWSPLQQTGSLVAHWPQDPAECSTG